MKLFLNKLIPEAGMNLLRASENIELIIPEKTELNREEWLAYCKKSDLILSVGKNTFDKDFFNECPNIKAIALFSVGFDNVDIIEATKKGIPVGNTPDVLSRATSDVAFLLMQSVARLASFNFDKVKKDNWKNFSPLENLGQELYGKTLGIFGLGRIGYEMTKKCKYAFDMEIIYHNRSQNLQAEEELGAKYVSFDELISQSDVLSIHANYSPNQQNLFNQSVFQKMKSKSIFINTARGNFHNEQDLYNALTSNEIWGAGLDVTNPEPVHADAPLLNLPRVCVLPHIGSATIEARNGMAIRAAENILAFTENRAMPYIVNKEVYI